MEIQCYLNGFIFSVNLHIFLSLILAIFMLNFIINVNVRRDWEFK